MELTEQESGYGLLLERISSACIQGRSRAAQAVNTVLIETYWQVGRHIVEFEQGGQERAGYGKALLEQLARDLTLRHGKGFSRSNLNHMRLFYQRYPICEKASHKLSWSHYVELLKLDDELERSFYERQTIAEQWSVPELRRQKASQLFLRLAASKDQAGILQLARQGQVVEQPVDLLREPYVFEFLKIPEPPQVSETQLESQLCDHLQPFLLELGKGFTFVGRQYRINVGGTHYRVDLVFYHRILRCFVLIDLKLGDVEHHDIGQMNLYLGRRQPAHRHHPQPPQGRTAGRVRHLRHEQPALRAEVPALPARARSAQAGDRANPQRGRAMKFRTLTSRIRELAERYATPLPKLTDEVATLAARVEEHLKKMGASWK